MKSEISNPQMNLHPDDPRLTAYLLGELPAEEAAAIKRAVATDPALQAALREMETVRDLLAETLTPQSATLRPWQRESIRRAAKYDKVNPLNIRRKSWKPWILPLAAAAAIALIIVISSGKPDTGKHIVHSESSSRKPERPAIKLLPAPGPADANQSTTAGFKAVPVPGSELPALRPRGYLAAADFPTLDLPVQSGKSSLEWIRKSILTDRRLPDHNAVRLEEILNSFPIRPTGVTVIARVPANTWHPDNRDNGVTSHAATIATETLACPWKPSASLILISIRGNPYADCEVRAVFHANPANVRRYRLLGFAPVEGRDQIPLPSHLPAKSATTVVIEVEPSTIAGDLGTIEWSVNQEDAPPVQLIRRGDAEPSDDARFAALICTYAQWLARENSGLIDHELLSALTRENASDTLPPDRADFLNLIRQSLDL
jgi:hypothetical protein